MSKFKVGDKVKLLKNICELDGYAFVKGINTSGVAGLHLCEVEDTSECLNFYEREIELISRKFTITRGDYIDSREFTHEECERFCELAVECGFERGDEEYSNSWLLLGISDGKTFVYRMNRNFTTNITTQFREFLDKEKGMKQFTKDDFKDGMRTLWRDGREFYVCGDSLISIDKKHNHLDCYLNDLKNNKYPKFDIMKVTDRDGTVLFEREEEPRELTLKEIAEQFGVPVERIRIKD
ncbi:MAG: hypothetical protein Tp136SUR676911_60 [Prokaryotic dsDNA virus sp.]|nr:MAG: hypothetical protein Tp136SUR676911_60 [Prokaryotic dsDNA virus sp.]|tara:strand:+ start:37901 stop:38614 length:714 start_codon:yes stop_codon:yes gene_type:complete